MKCYNGSNWWQHFNFSLLFNRMTALCVEYYLQHMSQEVLQMHNFQLLNPYCRVKGLSALDFKAFPCITFAFPTALKRHSAVFSLNGQNIFCSLIHTGLSFSRAPGVFLVVQCFEKGRNNNEQNRINSVVKKGKGCAWTVWDQWNVRAWIPKVYRVCSL